MATRIRLMREQTRDPAVVERGRNTVTALLRLPSADRLGMGISNGSQCELRWAGEETEISAMANLASRCEMPNS
jgi:hypothetical protein